MDRVYYIYKILYYYRLCFCLFVYFHSFVCGGSLRFDILCFSYLWIILLRLLLFRVWFLIVVLMRVALVLLLPVGIWFSFDGL